MPARAVLLGRLLNANDPSASGEPVVAIHWDVDRDFGAIVQRHSKAHLTGCPLLHGAKVSEHRTQAPAGTCERHRTMVRLHREFL